ncbi:hypothetical protein Plhal304r1_c034g0106411 [Plasmopara halstedii]
MFFFFSQRQNNHRDWACDKRSAEVQRATLSSLLPYQIQQLQEEIQKMIWTALLSIAGLGVVEVQYP